MWLMILRACRRDQDPSISLFLQTVLQCSHGMLMDSQGKLGLLLQLIVAAFGLCLPSKIFCPFSSDNSSCLCGYRSGHVTQI